MKMPAKRLLEGDSHHNVKNPPKFKRERASQGFSEVKDMDEIYKAATAIVAAMKANLLRTAGPSEVNS